MESNCFCCGYRNGENLVSECLTSYFTDKALARIPTSKYLCDFCANAIKLRCWYFNPNRDKWVKLFARGWSSLYQDDRLISPTIEGERTEGKDTMPIVSNLPTRIQIRDWLVHPPEPPFLIAISESGQKHILPWAQQGYSRDYYPVQFEMSTVWIDRAKLIEIMEHFEALMGLGFGKTEILTGEYRSENLKNNLADWFDIENAIEQYRGSRLFELVAHVVQAPEKPQEPIKAAIPLEKPQSTPQLALF